MTIQDIKKENKIMGSNCDLLFKNSIKLRMVTVILNLLYFPVISHFLPKEIALYHVSYIGNQIMNIYKSIYDMEKEMYFLKIGIYNKYSLSFIRISCMIGFFRWNEAMYFFL